MAHNLLLYCGLKSAIEIVKITDGIGFGFPNVFKVFSVIIFLMSSCAVCCMCVLKWMNGIFPLNSHSLVWKMCNYCLYKQLQLNLNEVQLLGLEKYYRHCMWDIWKVSFSQSAKWWQKSFLKFDYFVSNVPFQ